MLRRRSGAGLAVLVLVVPIPSFRGMTKDLIERRRRVLLLVASSLMMLGPAQLRPFRRLGLRGAIARLVMAGGMKPVPTPDAAALPPTGH